MDEFSIIKHYFASKATSFSSNLDLGIGDDCGIFHLNPLDEMTITTDTLVSGVHFFSNADPYSIGWKSLAVNVSDLAAMGATPRFFTLALTLPSDIQSTQPEFLAGFSQGLCDMANKCRIDLIGGDTTHGPLSITITALGCTPKGKAIKRSNAKLGDDIYVTGTLGDGALAVKLIKEKIEPPIQCRKKLEYPEPRIKVGIELRDVANSMLDLSDGLGSDLKHILNLSRFNAQIELTDLPLSYELTDTLQKFPNYNKATPWELALFGGDDYELCFTADSTDQKRRYIKNISESLGIKITRIGTITEKNHDKYGEISYLENGKEYSDLMILSGYNHFS